MSFKNSISHIGLTAELDLVGEPIFELAENLEIKRSHSSYERNYARHYFDEAVKPSFTAKSFAFDNNL